VKGHAETWGRVLALLALEGIQDQLTGYEIHLRSVKNDVAWEVKRLQSESTLNLVAHPKFSLFSEDVRTLPAQSDTACLPGSLVGISPENFVSTETCGR